MAVTTNAPSATQESCLAAAKPRDHHVFRVGSASRLALCGALPPWDHDQFTCRGEWRPGETTCADCGGPMCATCLRIVRTSS